MARLDSSLIKKLASKLKKPGKYIQEQISKKASQNHVHSEAYFVKWLKDEGIGCQVYFNRLKPEIQAQVRTLNEPVKVKISNTKKGGKSARTIKSYKVNNIAIQPTNKLIDQASINSAFLNANLYPDLFLFENSLRMFISAVLSKKYGSSWWNTRVNNPTKNNIASRMRKEEMNKWHGARGVEPIFYTDLSDLTTILRGHTNDFTPFFKDVTGQLTWLTQRLEEIYLTRNNLAHSAPLKKEDINRFKTYFSDWYRQISIIESSL